MSGFPITLETPARFTGPLPEAVDIAVIGGGIIGLLSAWALAAEGKRVLVCEKGRIAGEQSGRNWGWIRQQGRDLTELPMMVDALRLWAGLPEALRAAIGFRQTGITYLAHDEARMARFGQWLDKARAHGVDSRLLSRREVEAMLPNAAGWVGGLHTPSDGRAEPFVTVPTLAAAASEEGVTIRENCAVRRLDLAAGKVAGIVTEAGRVRCAQVVLAGGAWSSLFLRAHGVRLAQLSVLSPVFATEALPEILPGAAGDEHFAIRRRDDGGYTLTPWSSHEFYIGPDAFRHFRAFLPQLLADFSATRFRALAPPGYPDGWRTPRNWRADEVSPFERCRILNPTPGAGMGARLQDRFAAAFPQIGRPGLRAAWAGMIDATPDALPVIDHTPIPGLILATGMSGHGFGIGPGVAQVVADLAQGRTPRHDLSAFALARLAPGRRLAPGTAI